jgi:drug/metabolite transporter (DMT)-like permease
MSGLGIVAGLATAGLWTITAVCFESSSRWLGSFTVNLLRLFLACLMFLLLSLVRSGALLPSHLTASMWCNLLLSGLIGFVIGDIALFEAFVLIGARLSTLIYASVPAMTAVAAFLFLGEMLTMRILFGMLVTMGGIATAILGGPKQDVPVQAAARRRGILLALCGSAGQAAGLLLGKRGSIGLDAFAATEVRALAGFAGFAVLALVTRKMASIVAVVGKALRPRLSERSDAGRLRRALAVMLCGAVLGPFLGVSLGLKSVQLLPAGVASTLMSIVPVLLVPVSAIVFHERTRGLELLGTVGTLVGVAIMSV